MAKKKQARRNREKRRQKKSAKQRRTSKSSSAASRAVVLPAPPTLRPVTTGTVEPIHLAADGRVVPDPYERLGIEPGTRDREVIQAAFREAILTHSPEQEPEVAREIRESRDRLIAPERLLERELLVVRPLSPSADGGPSAARLDAEARLVGQAILYALVEDAGLVRPGGLHADAPGEGSPT